MRKKYELIPSAYSTNPRSIWGRLFISIGSPALVLFQVSEPIPRPPGARRVNRGRMVVDAEFSSRLGSVGRVAGGQLNTYFIALGGVELRVLRNHLYQRFLLTLKKYRLV